MAATERGTADIELFIGGISKVLGERDIADIIKQHADVEPVELRLMRDTHGDRGPVNESKGFGFAKVSQIAEAERMLQRIDGQVFAGRKWKVELSQGKKSEPIGGQGFAGRKRTPEPSQGKKTLFLGRLPFEWNSATLRRHLDEAGIHVAGCEFGQNRGTTRV